MRAHEFITEVAKIKLSTDPEDFGSWVTDRGQSEPTVMVPVGKLITFEPDDKFKKPENAKNLNNIVKALKAGKELPPILVRRQGLRYQVLDGHHRFMAYKMLGKKHIPVRIVAKANVTQTENFVDMKSDTESIDAVFHTIELSENEISDYTQRFFESYDIDRPYIKFISNIKRLAKEQINESKEHEQIESFVQLINSLDSLKKIKVGDLFSVLAFEIVFAWQEINVFGFTEPKEVAEIKLHKDNTINYIKFTDGGRYPRLTPATYNKKPIVQTAYFDKQSKAEQALTNLLLKVPGEWKVDTSGINNLEVNENFADGKKPGRKGLAKRSGVNTKATVTSLRKTAKNSSGEKQRMAHWLANMKSGKKK
jgi:hypothetical protein